MPGNPQRSTVLLVCFLLVAAVWLVFAQTLRHEFLNYDDGVIVHENPQVANGFSPHGISWAFTGSVLGHWGPLTKLSHMLDCQLFGLNPWGHHLTSVVLHSVSSVLLFLLLRQMTAALWPSAFVAIIFAVHPQHVESVAWITERKDMLSGLFFILTLGAYVRYVRGRSTVRYLAVVVLFACGLMSKSMLVSVPFVLLLLDYWPLARFSRRPGGDVASARYRSLIVEKLPLFALSLAACIVQIVINQSAIVGFDQISLSMRIQNAIHSYAIYLGQSFYPTNMAVYYPHPENGLTVLQVAMSAGLLVIITALSLYLSKSRPYFLVGWLWFLGMLAPVIGIVQSGWVARADRYTYLPYIGLSLSLAFAARDCAAHFPKCRRIIGGLSTIFVITLTLAAYRQTTHWKNSEELWSHTIGITGPNEVASLNLSTVHDNLGKSLLLKRDVEQAIAHFEKAVNLWPADARYWDNLGVACAMIHRTDEAIAHHRQALEKNPAYDKAHNNLGYALLQKGRVDEAVAELQRALEINPDYANAHNNLGNALLQKGELEAAIQHYEKAIALKPADGNVLANLGVALNRAGRVDEAIGHLNKALEIEPGSAKAHDGLGDALLMKKDFTGAIAQYSTALQIQPANPKVQNNLAWLLATNPDPALRDGSRAVDLARRADQATGMRNPTVLGTLAAAYAETGRFSEAVDMAKTALFLLNAAENPTLAGALAKQLECYESKQPFRDVR